MSLLCKSSDILNLFYRIRYDTWDIEKSFFIRAAFFTVDEALVKFKDEFPSVEGKIIYDVVCVN